MHFHGKVQTQQSSVSGWFNPKPYIESLADCSMQHWREAGFPFGHPGIIYGRLIGLLVVIRAPGVSAVGIPSDRN
jgi:hypothetical protein